MDLFFLGPGLGNETEDRAPWQKMGVGPVLGGGLQRMSRGYQELLLRLNTGFPGP